MIHRQQQKKKRHNLINTDKLENENHSYVIELNVQFKSKLHCYMYNILNDLLKRKNNIVFILRWK